MNEVVALPGLEDHFCEQHRLVLLREDEDLVGVTDNRLAPRILHTLALVTEGKIRIRYVDTTTYEAKAGAQSTEDIQPGADRQIVQLVRETINEAVHCSASDIHIEPMSECLRIRFRLDGQLRIHRDLGLELKDELISRVKVLADLDIAEKRRPQDGKIRMTVRSRPVDFRVSVIPTGLGEKAVIRILDREKVRLDLETLGMPDQVARVFGEVIHRPHGLMLVTGPTGSGKTTTLYAALEAIKSDRLNITTIEDPIEYQLEGLTQTQVRPAIGFDFSTALRGFLRQDPNVIMVGEIRDLETAEMSIRAASTGHLVLSTLHTNSAPGAIPRLLDMGLPAYLVGSALQLVIAQRLLRRICSDCRESITDLPTSALDYVSNHLPGVILYRGRGCTACNDQGYRGRVGVFEAFAVDDQVRSALGDGVSEGSLAKLSPGYQPMAKHAHDLLRQGLTSLDEMLREVVLG